MLRRGVLLAILIGTVLISSAYAMGVQLTWRYTQGGDPGVGFNVYRQIVSGGACNMTGIWTKVNSALVPVSQTSYTDTTISTGTQYCWYVTAEDAGGIQSVPSNTIIFLVQQPSQPQNLQGAIVP